MCPGWGGHIQDAMLAQVMDIWSHYTYEKPTGGYAPKRYKATKPATRNGMATREWLV